VGYIFGTYDALLTGGLHLSSAKAEEGGPGMAAEELGDDLCAVVIAGGLSGGEKDQRVGYRGDEISLESR
jgi:hypothetical protein